MVKVWIVSDDQGNVYDVSLAAGDTAEEVAEAYASADVPPESPARIPISVWAAESRDPWCVGVWESEELCELLGDFLATAPVVVWCWAGGLEAAEESR